MAGSNVCVCFQAELQLQEEQVYRERREREKILSRYKKQAEERMAQAERMKRRVSIICCNYIYSNYNNTACNAIL